MAEAWRSHCSTLAAFAGAPLDEFTDDLSIVGNAAYIESCSTLEIELKGARQGHTNTLDEAVLVELGRFVEEERHRAMRVHRARTLADHLDPVICGLVIALLNDRPNADELLEQRMSAMLDWMRLARELYETGGLSVTAADATRAACLEHEIAAISGRLKDTLRKQIREHLNDLAAELSVWNRAASPTTSVTDARNGVSEQVTRLGGDLVSWEEALNERLVQELDVLARAERDGHGLQWATQQFPLTPDEKHAWRTGAVDPPTGRSGRLKWIDHVRRRLREVVMQVVPSAEPDEAQVLIDPPLVDLLTLNGMFIPGPSPAYDRVLVPTKIFGSRQASRRSRAFLAMTIAHEGTPGHAVHQSLQRRGPCAEFLYVLRNPLGLEGWGMYAERQVALLDAESVGVVAYHTIRRLLPAAIQLTRLVHDSQGADALMRRSLGACPSLAPEILSGHFGSSRPLIYSIGLIETERAVAKLAGNTQQQPHGEELLARYLACGTFAPAQATRVIARSIA